jgi:hypothetical protein
MQITDADQVMGRLSRMYSSIRNQLIKHNHMTLNRTTASQVRKLALLANMKACREQRYSMLLPGMGRLQREWLLEYELFTLRSPWLSKHGSELILLFSKGC